MKPKRGPVNRSQGNFPCRQQYPRAEKRRILIVAEGKITEQCYFSNFKSAGYYIKVKGAGKNPETVVRSAIDLMEKARQDEIFAYDEDIYSKLDPLLQTAIKNAYEVREKDHDIDKPTEDCNSSTDVYKLIKKLISS